MIKSISQSTVNMALRCGEQFRRRYLEGEVVLPGVTMLRGTSVHKASQVNLTAKIRTGQDEPLSVLLDAAEDTFRKEAANGIYLSRAEVPEKTNILEKGLTETLGLTNLYRNAVAPEIVPVHVERKFVIDMGFEFPLTGYLDIEAGEKIHDLKTASMKWPEDRIQQEIQPVFYSMAFEHEFGRRPGFKYHILIPYKKGPQRQVQEITVTDSACEVLKAKIRLVEDMLRAGIFMPAYPGSWWCAEKWCGFWNTCRFVGNAPAGKWV